MPTCKILLMGASYGSLLASKLLFGGHSVHLVCLPAEADLINAEGFKVRLPVRGRAEPVLLESRKLPGKVTAGPAEGVDPKAYRTDERLVEVSFGDWEGSTIKELKATQRDRVTERNLNKWDFIPPGDDAESYEIMSWRIASWLNSVDKPTVCVTHGGVIRSLFKMIADVPKHEAAEGDIPQDRILKIDRAERLIGWI